MGVDVNRLVLPSYSATTRLKPHSADMGFLFRRLLGGSAHQCADRVRCCFSEVLSTRLQVTIADCHQGTSLDLGVVSLGLPGRAYT